MTRIEVKTDVKSRINQFDYPEIIIDYQTLTALDNRQQYIAIRAVEAEKIFWSPF